MELEKVAPCGIDCVNCELYEKNNRVDVLERVAKITGKTIEELKCKGCRLQGGCTMHENCETLACVQDKEVNFCFDCNDFPCKRLQPMKEGADRYPHNLKVYNLCQIQKMGIEKFLEQSALTRQLYFSGNFVIGAGPSVTEK